MLPPRFVKCVGIEPIVSLVDHRVAFAALDAVRVLSRRLLARVAQHEAFRSYPFNWTSELDQVLFAHRFPKHASASRALLSIGFGWSTA